MKFNSYLAHRLRLISKNNIFWYGRQSTRNVRIIFQVLCIIISWLSVLVTKYAFCNVKYIAENIHCSFKKLDFVSISLRWILMRLHDQDLIVLVLDPRNQKISLRSNKHLSVAHFYERTAANPDQVQLMCQLNITDIQWMYSLNIFPKLPTQTPFALYKWL